MDSSNVQNEDKLLGYLPFGIPPVQTPKKPTWKPVTYWVNPEEWNIRNLQQEVSELRQELRQERQERRNLHKIVVSLLSKRKIVRKTFEHKRRVIERDPWELIEKIGPIDIDIERLDHFLNNF